MDNSYLESLYELARELNTALEITVILDTVINHLPKVIGAKYCSLFLKNPASGELEIKAHNHLNIGDDPFIHVDQEEENIMNLVITRNTSIIVRDIEEEIGVQNKEKYSTKSFMCIIIKHGNKIKGIINLADKIMGGFNKDDMLVSAIIAELLGALLSRINFESL